MNPGGKMCKAGGVLFWMTKADYWVFVINLVKPVKSYRIVSRLLFICTVWSSDS